MPFKDKKKQREYQNAWTLKRRLCWLEANGPCVKCSSEAELQVDHVDQDSKVSHRIWTWSDARRVAELRKCQVLCLKCHKEKTAEAYRASVKHGSYAMRNTYGCSCELCMEYVRESKRISRARTGRN